MPTSKVTIFDFGGGEVLVETSRKCHEGGGSQIFSNPQRVILTFLHSGFWIFPMNLVALAEDFQNEIFFIAQGTYPEF